MRPATRVSAKQCRKTLYRWLVFPLVAIGAMLLASANQSQEMLIIDLTQKLEVKPWLQAPGAGFGVIVGGPHPVFSPPRYQLPLVVKIESVKPSSVTPTGKFVIELLVHNAGQTPFYLPRFRDPWKVHTEGHKGRRTLLFLVRFDLPDQSQLERIVVASTDSAETVPESMLRLAPGQSVRALLPADLGPVRDRLPPKTRDVTFRVILHEWTLEDDRYFIKALSEDLESANAATVAIRKEKSAPQH